jgi:hypothetical protein
VSARSVARARGARATSGAFVDGRILMGDDPETLVRNLQDCFPRARQDRELCRDCARHRRAEGYADGGGRLRLQNIAVAIPCHRVV